MQASGLAQRAGHPLIDAFGLDAVTVLAGQDFKRLQASQLEKVRHSAPWANPH